MRRGHVVRAGLSGHGAGLGTAFAAGGPSWLNGCMSDSTQAESINAQALTKLQETAGVGPVVMLNLLRFKPEGGAESYSAYGTAVAPLLENAGGEVVYAGQPNELVIGSDRWDLMLLVRYPTRGAFLQMITSAEYLEISNLRDAALEESVLYATDPLG